MYVHHGIHDLIFNFVGTLEASQVCLLSLFCHTDGWIYKDWSCWKHQELCITCSRSLVWFTEDIPLMILTAQTRSCSVTAEGILPFLCLIVIIYVAKYKSCDGERRNKTVNSRAAFCLKKCFILICMDRGHWGLVTVVTKLRDLMLLDIIAHF